MAKATLDDLRETSDAILAAESYAASGEANAQAVRDLLKQIPNIRMAIVREVLGHLEAHNWEVSTEFLQWLWQLWAGKAHTKSRLEDLFGVARQFCRRVCANKPSLWRTGVVVIPQHEFENIIYV